MSGPGFFQQRAEKLELRLMFEVARVAPGSERIIPFALPESPELEEAGR
jgi:hypothetical protein